jgi:hypothetical protein
MTAVVAMSHKGAFSYLQGNVNYINVTDDGHLRVHIERVTNNVARVFVVDQANVQQDLPANMTMEEDGQAMAAFGNQYMITWAAKYKLRMGAEVVLEMGTKKEQWLTGPATRASGVV